jgi:hypothetical protein
MLFVQASSTASQLLFSVVPNLYVLLQAINTA